MKDIFNSILQKITELESEVIAKTNFFNMCDEIIINY